MTCGIGQPVQAQGEDLTLNTAGPSAAVEEREAAGRGRRTLKQKLRKYMPMAVERYGAALYHPISILETLFVPGNLVRCLCTSYLIPEWFGYLERQGRSFPRKHFPASTLALGGAGWPVVHQTPWPPSRVRCNETSAGGPFCPERPMVIFLVWPSLM